MKKQKKSELVVYHLVPRQFAWENIYAISGVEPNAKFVAQQYECELEFRRAQFKDRPQGCLIARDKYEIEEDGSCLGAVLIGEDRGKLVEARDDIRETFGVSSFRYGTINVGNEESL